MDSQTIQEQLSPEEMQAIEEQQYIPELIDTTRSTASRYRDLIVTPATTHTGAPDELR